MGGSIPPVVGLHYTVEVERFLKHAEVAFHFPIITSAFLFSFWSLIIEPEYSRPI